MKTPLQLKHYTLIACAALFALVMARRAEANPTYTGFDVPGSAGTFPQSINNEGVIVGYYEDGGSAIHGFIRTTDGAIATFDVRRSAELFPVSINSDGVVTGYYQTRKNNWHAFERTADGTITTFDVHGSVCAEASAVNAKLTIVGYYNISCTPGSTAHGFIRKPGGKMKKFDIADSLGTVPYGVNSKGHSPAVTKIPPIFGMGS